MILRRHPGFDILLTTFPLCRCVEMLAVDTGVQIDAATANCVLGNLQVADATMHLTTAGTPENLRAGSTGRPSTGSTLQTLTGKFRGRPLGTRARRGAAAIHVTAMAVFTITQQITSNESSKRLQPQEPRR